MRGSVDDDEGEGYENEAGQGQAGFERGAQQLRRSPPCQARSRVNSNSSPLHYLHPKRAPFNLFESHKTSNPFPSWMTAKVSSNWYLSTRNILPYILDDRDNFSRFYKV